MKKDFFKSGKKQLEHITTPIRKAAISSSRGFLLLIATMLLVGLVAVFAIPNIAKGVGGSKAYECSRTYPKCDMNATRVKGVCQCNKGYYGNGTSCTACSDGKTTAKWGQTTASACTYPYGLSFQIMAIVPASNTQCSSANYYNASDTSYCYLTCNQETSDIIKKYNLVSQRGYDVNNICNDHWGGAMKYCQDRGWRMPTLAELEEMVDTIYLSVHPSCKSMSNQTSCNASLIQQQPLIQFLGVGGCTNNYLCTFLSNVPTSGATVDGWAFETQRAFRDVNGLRGWGYSAICVK